MVEPLAESLPADDESRRAELAAFLRNRRSRVRPDKLGIETNSRRRIIGLRREEVAVLAGMSLTWYKYLEQAREVRPSPGTLDRLAVVLQLSEDERRYLQALVHPVGPHSTAALMAGDGADRIVSDLVRSTDSIALPVYAANLYTDVIAINMAGALLYSNFGGEPDAPGNVLSWMLFDPTAKNVLPEWSLDTSDIVARWRSVVTRWGTDHRIDRMVVEFRERSTLFRRAWDDVEVQEHRSRVRLFTPVGGEPIALQIVVLQAPDLAPRIVVFHLPVQA